jgi:hypothetical protein
MARHTTNTATGRTIKARQGGGGAGTGAIRLSSGSGATTAMEFAVPVTPGVLRTLAARPSTVKSLVNRLGKVIAHTQKSGQASGFTVIIDAKGNPKFEPLQDPASPAAVSTEDDRLEAALDAARERGRVRSALILDRSDMLTAEAFAGRLGVSRMTVNARRQKHELLALDGAKRGFRFPAWQVDEDGKAYDVLPKLFDLLGDNPWTVYRFLTQRHAVLDGVAAKDALHQGKAMQVLQAAESLAQGDFA